MEAKSIYDKWNDGELSAEAALENLCRQLDRLQDSIGPLEEQHRYVRSELSLMVERAFEGRARVEGFGELRITEPALTVSYDRRELDELVIELLGNGQEAIAKRIQACRRESSRVGSLRIDRLRLIK